MSTGPGPGTGGTGETEPSPDDPASFFTRLSLVINQPRVWLVSILLGIPLTVETLGDWADCDAETAAELQTCTGVIAERVAIPLSRKSAVAVILDDFLFRTILRPAARALFGAGVSAVDLILLTALGGNRQIGVGPGAGPGLVEWPIVIAIVIANWITAAFEFGVGVLDSTISDIAAFVATAGLPAPIVSAGLWFGLLGVMALGGWILVRSVDVPFFDPVGFYLALTRPLRNLWRWLF